jgi:hypothetical protein
MRRGRAGRQEANMTASARERVNRERLAGCHALPPRARTMRVTPGRDPERKEERIVR